MFKELGIIGSINYLIMQWFFTRIYYCENEKGQTTGYGLIFPIVPLTGWYDRSYKPTYNFELGLRWRLN